MKYSVIIEQGPTSFGASVPDLPGCIAVAASREEVMHLIREAITFHIEGLKLHGEAVPAASSNLELIDVNVAA